MPIKLIVKCFTSPLTYKCHSNTTCIAAIATAFMISARISDGDHSYSGWFLIQSFISPRMFANARKESQSDWLFTP